MPGAETAVGQCLLKKCCFGEFVPELALKLAQRHVDT
jgi:hypothetical protein